MKPLIDDVGSFPLPAHTDKTAFGRAYVAARRAICSGKAVQTDEMNDFRRVVVDSFRKKCATGLDVVSYPQHYDMYKQFTDLINEAMEDGTYVVDRAEAVIPEIPILEEEAKRLSEDFGGKIRLRVCVTGPLELYLRAVGTIGYEDVLLMFAETVRRFAENAILDTKYVKTEVISIDEPSLGFQEISAERETVVDVLEKTLGFPGAIRQIHLHSPMKIADLVEVRRLDVLSFEFGASPRNLESVSKAMLDKADKSLRVGIARTDIDAIIAELHDKGVKSPTANQIVESEETILKRFILAKERFRERLSFAGPDCGLGGWPTQESALLLLQRTVNAIRRAILE